MQQVRDERQRFLTRGVPVPAFSNSAAPVAKSKNCFYDFTGAKCLFNTFEIQLLPRVTTGNILAEHFDIMEIASGVSLHQRRRQQASQR